SRPLRRRSTRLEADPLARGRGPERGRRRPPDARGAERVPAEAGGEGDHRGRRPPAGSRGRGAAGARARAVRSGGRPRGRGGRGASAAEAAGAEAGEAKTRQVLEVPRLEGDEQIQGQDPGLEEVARGGEGTDRRLRLPRPGVG